MKFTGEQLGILEKFVSTPTPTGSEQPGMLLLGKRIKDETGLKPYIDVHGNLHCVLDCGAKRTAMIEGHCDEIGFLVQYIDDDGFIYLSALGGVTIPTVASERVVIAGPKGPVKGVFGVRPPHLLNQDERAKIAPKELRSIPCDIGAKSREEALEVVALGNSAVVDSGWRPLLGSRVSCRGFDNRIGAFAMCETFIKLAKSSCKPGVNVHFVASVQEEVGLIGGHTTAFDIHPDIGICCDVTFATDSTKEDRKTCGDIRLGSGPVLAIGPTYHANLRKHFERAAESCGITPQIQPRARGNGTCAFAMRLEHGGAAVAQVSIPLRYMHSPVETIDLSDVEGVIDMTAAAIGSLDDSFELLPEQP